MTSHTDTAPLVPTDNRHTTRECVENRALSRTDDPNDSQQCAANVSGKDSQQTLSDHSMDLDTAGVKALNAARGRHDRGVGEEDERGEVFTINSMGRTGTLNREFSMLLESGRSTPWQHYCGEVMGEFTSVPSMEGYTQFIGLDETALIQAVVFIEDAYKYRSINHKVDEDCLRLYRHYNSTFVYVVRWVIIFTLHILAFFESPSSLTWTSDMRYRGDQIESPCWVMEGIELLCLLLLLLDNCIRAYLMGKYYFWRHKWDVAAVILLLFSLVDWTVSASLGCTEVVRVRRMVRPFFILQNSSLMKKTVNCLCRTLPEVFSVLLMLGMHLYIFTLFAMLMFPTPQDSDRKRANHSRPHRSATDDVNNSQITEAPIIVPDTEGNQYFSSMLDSFMSLLVLLTTANNPDVTMPAYSRSRLFSIFFMLFLIVGLYCFWNMLTAVIYNQFRGYFLSSMQSSLTRRRLGVRAAFEVLRRKRGLLQYAATPPIVSTGVGGYVIKSLVEQIHLPPPLQQALLEKVTDNLEMTYSATDFQNVFLTLDKQVNPPQEVGVRWFQHPLAQRLQNVIVHKYFSFFGIFMATCNVIIIAVELDTEFAESFDDNASSLRVANFVFANYYVAEQLLKVWASGVRRYLHFRFNIFEALITLALVVCEMYSIITFGPPFFFSKNSLDSIKTLWNILRIINILIMVRLLKIIPYIKSMQVISSVLLDLIINMKAFAGVLVVIYYVFAILGMELFQNVIQFNNATDSNRTFECGSYRQLQYWANNFDDFASSLVVLWDVMVVNNWMVFLEAYRKATSAWSYLYFVAWWMISVIIVLNLFTALIMENFILKWDSSHQARSTQDDAFNRPVSLNTVHDLFRGLLQEPADNELLMELCRHQHLKLRDEHQPHSDCQIQTLTESLG